MTCLTPGARTIWHLGVSMFNTRVSYNLILLNGIGAKYTILVLYSISLLHVRTDLSRNIISQPATLLEN